MICKRPECDNLTQRQSKYCSNACRFIQMRRRNMEVTMDRMKGIYDGKYHWSIKVGDNTKY